LTFGLVVVAIVVFIPLIIAAFMYNVLVSRKNRVENAFASVDVQLKKRFDLIPNLVATVKGYMDHERGVLEEVTNIRAKAISGNMSADEKIDADNRLTGFLRTIMVSVENYPQLKANENFLKLQGALNEVEEQISAARRAYNASVMSYNNAVEMFPTNILASVIGYKRRASFEAGEAERQVPEDPKTFNRK